MAQRTASRPLRRRIPRRTPLRDALGAVLRFAARFRFDWRWLQAPLIVLALVHLALVALFPGGRNALFGYEPADTPGYLTFFRVDDTLGFYKLEGRDGFLVYKVFTQDGTVLNGVFPDTGVSPRLRYDRWAMLGDAATGPYPVLHETVASYVLDHLPSPPLRLELFAADWWWDRNRFRFPYPGTHVEAELELRMLGTYNGLTREWKPAKDGSSGS